MNLSKIKTLIGPIALSLLTLATLACKKDNGPIAPGNDPNFKIVGHTDQGFKKFNRKVNVFGIDIYAVPKMEDDKLLHAANVLAQYLDNNEDGMVDNSVVLDHMIQNKAYLVMWNKQRDLNINPPNDRVGQDLGNDETHPNFVINGKTGEFDASLEEILHLIHNAGYSYAYPSVFGQNQESRLAKAMDKARGGHFKEIPKNYPDNAWYTYDDNTCDYATCQTIEYLYWAQTSIIGAQENRGSEIAQEWKLNTRDKVAKTDTAIFSIIEDSTFTMASILPDGSYLH